MCTTLELVPLGANIEDRLLYIAASQVRLYRDQYAIGLSKFSQ